MTTEEAISLEDRFQIPTYAKLSIVLDRGEGSYVWDAEGRRYLDYYGGHCVALLGHSPPRVVEAIKRQADALLFYSNAVYSTTRAKASEALASVAPAGLRHVFFCNSGSEANETALKLARKSTGKQRVLAMTGGFHGRTLGSLAVTWKEKYRQPYRASLAETTFVPFGDVDRLEQAFAEHTDIAAVILEPIQSMAGVVEAPENYYREIRRVCDRYGAVLIFDEVQTGVGRTGTFSVAEQYGMTPHLITLAKSLGSGVPVGAVLVSDDIAEGVEPGDQGTTFGGGMLAMAAVEATIRAIAEDALMARSRQLYARIEERLPSEVRELRGRGCLIGLVLDEPAKPLRNALLKEGVITGGADDPRVIRLMPPINAPLETVDEFVAAFERALDTRAVQP